MNAVPLRIFIGYDSVEPLAYHTLVHSIIRRTSIPVSITPLVLSSLRITGYTRPRGPLESTEFSLTRFLVPYLSNYEGRSLFMDCDMLCRVDLVELLPEVLRQRDKAVLVCQHDYMPTALTKFLDHPQTAYPRKNWSSFVVFNNAKCKALSLDYVNSATGLALHRFEWTEDDAIGSLPLAWNWLCGEYAPNPDAKILHFTTGGPWFPACAGVDGADEWQAEHRALLTVGGVQDTAVSA